MYVCLCNPTTDSQIEETCKQVSSLKELKNKLSICNCCGLCAREVKLIYKSFSNSSPQPSLSQVASTGTKHEYIMARGQPLRFRNLT